MLSPWLGAMVSQLKVIKTILKVVDNRVLKTI
jgi:hypothetical protein